MHLKFLSTLCLILTVNGLLPGVANAAPGEPRRPFELPTPVRRPLPYTLQTAQDWQTVGMNALVAQDYINSLQAFNKAVDLSAGQNPEILEQRGWVYYLQKRYDAAIADMNRAAALYQDQSQTTDYRNVRRIRLFIETQAERRDAAS